MWFFLLFALEGGYDDHDRYLLSDFLTPLIIFDWWFQAARDNPLDNSVVSV